MSVTELKTLASVIRKTWKDLALADQTDADSLLQIIKETLESLETLEGGE
jgi:hypothetical protein